MATKKWMPPPKEPCHCQHFCIENTEQTGRYCKVEAVKQGKPSADNTGG